MTSISRLSVQAHSARPIASSAAVPAARNRLPAAGLGASIAPFTKVATYISESDYHPQIASAAMAGSGPLDDLAVLKALRPALAAFDKGGLQPLSTKTSETMTGDEAESFIKGLSDKNDADATDASPKAWGKITTALRQNLTDLMVIKYGPRADSGELAVDQGLYAFLVVGRSIDKKVCGVIIGSLET